MTFTLQVYPWAARPLAMSAALTRPSAPVSGFDPGPQRARGTAAGSAPRAGPKLTPAQRRTAAATPLQKRTNEAFVADRRRSCALFHALNRLPFSDKSPALTRSPPIRCAERDRAVVAGRAWGNG